MDHAGQALEPGATVDERIASDRNAGIVLGAAVIGSVRGAVLG